MNHCIIEKNHLGIAQNMKTPEEYVNAILSIASLDQSSYNEMCKQVSETEKDFNYKVLSEKIIEIIES